MKRTENFGLNKPELNEKYDVAKFNENADIIDDSLKFLQDNLGVKINDEESNPAETYSSQKIEQVVEDKADKAELNAIPLLYNQNTDILAYALTCPQAKRTLVRIHSTNATNNPFGVSTDTDFIYEISKIETDDLWISIKAKDVRTSREFLNTKNNVNWLGWQELVTKKDLILTADGDRSTAVGNDVPCRWHIIDNGNYAICIGYNTEAFSVDTADTMFSMQLPAGYRCLNAISSNVFIKENIFWVTGATHIKGNGAGTYITNTGIVEAKSFRQIVLAIKE